ncbi:hypothetical protein Taro_038982 [Colocasia esculenta]|uniref:1,3-beta-glucan synthase component FKS1-like domain-containing protein n=1 Tax=Colocasia esculenta TaxID=4460 RepID=A0A843WHI0_COLES|nr:hypothetical protein [Colocasia esculenta]
MAEITSAPAEDSSRRGTRRPGRPPARPRTAYRALQPFDSEKVPVNLASHVQRFLRIANQIEAESPRAAYLCRFHAFERAHTMDPSSEGRGVRQFKTALLKRLQQMLGEETEENTGCYNILPLELGGSQHAIMQLPEIKASVAAIRNIRGLPLSENHQKAGASVDLLDWLQHWFGFQLGQHTPNYNALLQKGNVANQREHLVLLLANLHVRQTPKPASMSKVLILRKNSVPKLDDRAVSELMEKMFQNYNNWCRFLDRSSNIQLPHVKQEDQQYKILYICLYLLIWGEASNLRLMPECLCYIFHHMAYELSGMLFGSISLNTGDKVTPAYGGGPESFLKNVVTPLYMVIYEVLYPFLFSSTSLTYFHTWFIYELLHPFLFSSTKKNNRGTADHSRWRNYDDLNEYFWSVMSTDCFKIGWPLRLDCDFFCTKSKYQNSTNLHVPSLHFIYVLFSLKYIYIFLIYASTCEGHQGKWLGKMNFVEIRSFLHLFRSFDRMWLFFISAYQVQSTQQEYVIFKCFIMLLVLACYSMKVIIIMAWHALESPFQLFNSTVFEDVMSIFITCAFLQLMTVILDIICVWKTRQTMSISQMLRIVMKMTVAIIWMITLPIYYARSRQNSFCSSNQNWNQFGRQCLPEYMTAVIVYLMSSAIEMALFFVPAVRNYIETSDWTICAMLSWWSQIKPLVESTKQIMQISVSSYEWHELLPGVMNNVGAALAVWVPITIVTSFTCFFIVSVIISLVPSFLSLFLFIDEYSVDILQVYFMDTQIWYSIFCAVFGGVYGIFCHLGEIRTMGMVRSRFISLPAAFNTHFIPPSSNKEENKNIMVLLENKFFRIIKGEKDGYVKFAAVWNHIVNSFRAEDLISNRCGSCFFTSSLLFL